MRKLASALGLKITWVEARRKEEGFVRWIAERVLEVRREKVRLMVRPILLSDPECELGRS